ncbi:MAG: outer membrane beta-barrel protein [Terriglobia bacterium]|jgi:peptidoglycan-associated lipoprotein
MISVLGRRVVPLLAALLLCTAVGRGQGASPVDVSLGYSYLRANAPPGQCGCFSMNGGSGAVAVSLGPHVSAVADLGGYFQNNVVSSGRSLTLETYLVGLRYSYRHSKKWTPFAQFLAGGAHGSGTLYGSATTSGSASRAAMSAGGGLDWNASRNMSVRLFQAEYLMTRLPNAVNDYQNDLRLTFGVVLHFGKPRRR